MHIIQTGHGVCHVDRWPDPRAVLADSARNYALVGEPDAVAPADLQGPIDVGFVDAPEPFDALLRATFPALTYWPRVILALPNQPLSAAAPTSAIVRRLGPADAAELGAMDPALAWIAHTWGSPRALAASGYAWGSFADGRVAEVACSFFVGVHYEDIGVVTQPAQRDRGLSTACAAGLSCPHHAHTRRVAHDDPLGSATSRSRPSRAA